MAKTAEEQLKQMYSAQLESQKAQLTNDYQKAASGIDQQKEQNQMATDANLNATASEAQKRAMNDAEYYAAAGLTSGAKAQARIARDNQVMADMATIRAAQQTSDAELERQKGLLAQEYDSAIRKAQSENDYNLAKELYDRAKTEEDNLRTTERENAKNAAALLAEEMGDYSRYGQLYGLTGEEIASLNLANRNTNDYELTNTVSKNTAGDEVVLIGGTYYTWEEIMELDNEGKIEEKLAGGKRTLSIVE